MKSFLYKMNILNLLFMTAFYESGFYEGIDSENNY